MPTFNAEKYLHVAIKSIQNQTYKNWELNIIDDTDNNIRTLEIISFFQDIRIKYFKGPKKNLAAALNFGIKISNGDFIARMDADDISFKNRLKIQLDYLQVNKLDICGSNIRLFGNDFRINTYPEKPEEIKFAALFTCPLAHPTVLGKRKLFEKFPYSENFKVEDYELWVRMLKSYVKIGNVPKILLKYRIHNSSSTAFVSDEVIFERAKISQQYFAHFQDLIKYRSLEILDFGFRENYSLNEVEDIVFEMGEIYKKKHISGKFFAKMISVYYRKISGEATMSILSYLKVLYKYNLQISYSEFIMVMLKIIFINKSKI
jgi:glycosyltransferase involved in cell wall biosynthesis